MSFENHWASLKLTPSSYINRKALYLFWEELEALYQSLEGEVIFSSTSGDGTFELELIGDGLGHIKVQLALTNNRDSSDIRFEMDQSELLMMIRQCRKLLETYPYTALDEIHYEQIFT